MKSIFSLNTDVFLFLNNCFWFCRHTQVPFFTQLFLSNLQEAFKVFQKFPHSLIRVMTMLTLCPRSRWLCQHRVCMVNDYAKLCPRSQLLRWHCVSVVGDYFSKCPHSQRPRRQGVRVVYENVEMQFSKISNYILCYFFL